MGLGRVKPDGCETKAILQTRIDCERAVDKDYQTQAYLDFGFCLGSKQATFREFVYVRSQAEAVPARIQPK